MVCNVVSSQPQADDMVDIAAVLSRRHLHEGPSGLARFRSRFNILRNSRDVRGQYTHQSPAALLGEIAQAEASGSPHYRCNMLHSLSKPLE